MKSVAKSELFRELPSVDEVVRSSSLLPLVEAHGANAITDAARSVLARLREEIGSGLLDSSSVHVALQGLSVAIEKQVTQSLSYSLRPVINATGVILHTNLGRAALAASALQHIAETAAGYSNLEFDVETGERGKRDVQVDRHFLKLLADTASAPHVGS
jgi:L-seryl-tRNA(Ser) seleniumtransferase